MSPRSEIAAGILLAGDQRADRATVIEQAEDELRRRLHPSTVWQSAYLPPELRGDVAYGNEIPLCRVRGDITADEEQALETAWVAALPPLDRGMRQYLRVRVDSPRDVRRLRSIGEIDGLTIVPSLDSRGQHRRPLIWRWPMRVGVVPGPNADEWLAAVQNTSHHGFVFDAELFDATVEREREYDIAIVSATDLPSVSGDGATVLGARSSCVIVAGGGSIAQHLMELESRITPTIAIAVDAPPAAWWGQFFHEMSHDVPIDAAVESIVRFVGVDALIAGPRWGMDITASAHWFAAVAFRSPDLAPLLDEFAGWDWRHESGGARTATDRVRALRARGGPFSDPNASVSPLSTYGNLASRDMDFDEWPVAAVGDEAAAPETEAAAPETEAKPSKPRRLIARVFDGESMVTSILPPKRDLTLAVRIAIPEHGDVAADKAAPALPSAPGPSVELDVVVRGDVWPQQPARQTISISRENVSQPSTWAAFPFTTPDSGGVVSIEVLVLYQGKPLQAATYVSPVRSAALPGERPTLTTFALSGPDEPSDESRPVDATLVGTGAVLRHHSGSDAEVLITDVQAMLDKIEDRVSRVLGVPGAPDSFDDPRALGLLITLANLGAELDTMLAPLELGDKYRINVIINPTTRVLPLELTYAGPAPHDHAQLCQHDEPPPAGKACTRASSTRVCPYAFWGLHRSIARTVAWKQTRRPVGAPSPVPAFSILYAATVIADDGASDPLPSASVLEAAETVFPRVTRVTSWTAWRKAVKQSKPNLLVVLGHTMVEGGKTNLYIGRKSALARPRISAAELRTTDSPPPIVLLIACATAALGDPFGTLPGTLTAKGAGAVVGTLSKIVGPHGAAATTHLLRSFHEAALTGASVGDAVAGARRSLVADQRPIGLILVSHGEVDTKVVA